jgi:hypothetical protein
MKSTGWKECHQIRCLQFTSGGLFFEEEEKRWKMCNREENVFGCVGVLRGGRKGRQRAIVYKRWWISSWALVLCWMCVKMKNLFSCVWVDEQQKKITFLLVSILSSCCYFYGRILSFVKKKIRKRKISFCSGKVISYFFFCCLVDLN